jgi:hypothetical protein
MSNKEAWQVGMITRETSVADSIDLDCGTNVIWSLVLGVSSITMMREEARLAG